MTLAPGPSGKGPAAFRTISEASAELGVPQHVLRFWETRFAFIRPTKRAGGRRFYRPQDLAVLRGVRALLQDEGYTIKGVQKLHKDHGLKRLVAASGLEEAAASRLAAEVEADPAPSRVEPLAPTIAAGEADGPETGDLFGADPPSPANGESVTLEQRPARSRPLLDVTARSRLSEVLTDLEAVKADIDALLRD